MDLENQITTDSKDSEKGAAMIMALLVSFLLLTASAGLLLESSMNAANMTDAVAEQQAYHAAESGIQSAVHVLRCQKNTNT
jgi:type II secretory pathway component PulK